MDRGHHGENGREWQDEWRGGGGAGAGGAGGRKRPVDDGSHHHSDGPPHKRHDNRRGPEGRGHHGGGGGGANRRRPPPHFQGHDRRGGGGPGQHAPLHLNHFDRRGGSPPRGGGRGPHGGPRGGPREGRGPEVMMSYKEFLHSMPDDVTPEDAMAAYEAYKDDLKRRDTARYFAEHKNDEDFKAKYDPETTPAPLAAYHKSVQASAVSWMASAMGSTSSVVPSYTATPDMIESLKRDAEATAPVTADVSPPTDAADAKDADSPADSAAAAESDAADADSSSAPGDGEADKSDAPAADDASAGNGAGGAGEEAEKVYPLPRMHEREHKLFIRGVKPACTERHILDVCSRMPGLKGVQLNDGSKGNSPRFGWIEWDSERSMLHALRCLQGWQMPDFAFHLTVHVDRSPGSATPVHSNRTLIAPLVASTEARLASDLDSVTKLIQFLDKERGVTWWEEKEADPSAEPAAPAPAEPAEPAEPVEPVEGAEANGEAGEAAQQEQTGEEGAAAPAAAPAANRVETENPILSGALWDVEDVGVETRLDAGLAYLRQVHAYDFYTGIEGVNQADLNDRACRIVLRQPLTADNTMASLSEKDALSGQEWIRELDAKVASRLGAGAPSLLEQRVQEARQAFVERNTKAQGNDIWVCEICGKRFRSADFVHKHIRTKHAAELDAESARAVESVYYENFLSDPAHFALMSGTLTRQGANAAGPALSRVGRGGGVMGGFRSGGGGGGGGRGPRGGNRGFNSRPPPPPPGRAKLNQYVDLDAPDTDMDDFFKQSY